MNTKNIGMIVGFVAVLGLAYGMIINLLSLEAFGLASVAVVSAIYGVYKKFEVEELQRNNEQAEMVLEAERVQAMKNRDECSERVNEVLKEKSDLQIDLALFDKKMKLKEELYRSSLSVKDEIIEEYQHEYNAIKAKFDSESTKHQTATENYNRKMDNKERQLIQKDKELIKLKEEVVALEAELNSMIATAGNLTETSLEELENADESDNNNLVSPEVYFEQNYTPSKSKKKRNNKKEDKE